MDHGQNASKKAGAMIDRAGRHRQPARQCVCVHNGSGHGRTTHPRHPANTDRACYLEAKPEGGFIGKPSKRKLAG